MEDGKSIKVTVVELKELKYIDVDSKEKDIPVPFYVGSGSTVKFKAYSTISGVWPKGEPVWGGVSSGNTPDASITFKVETSITGAEEENTVSVRRLGYVRQNLYKKFFNFIYAFNFYYS